LDLGVTFKHFITT